MIHDNYLVPVAFAVHTRDLRLDSTVQIGFDKAGKALDAWVESLLSMTNWAAASSLVATADMNRQIALSGP